MTDRHQKIRDPAEDEGRAITAAEVTLFGVECYLPSSIAEAVEQACAAQQQQQQQQGQAVATVSGEFSEVRQDGEVYWLQTVLLKRPQQLPFGAPLYTAPPPSAVPEGVAEEVLREVLRRVAADADGLLVLAKIARDEAGRLRELVTSMLAAAPEPGEPK